MSSSLRLLVALLALPTLGCGVIFNGTRQNVHVTSSPNGATVSTNPTTAEYRTPASLNLERKNTYTLTLSMDGYSSATFEVGKHLQGGILALDILFTGLIGVIVDAATGSWFSLKPETVNLTLERVAFDGGGPATIEVLVRTDVDDADFRIESSVPGVTVEVETH